MKIALAGNPNCGKTTLFNTLTGSTAHVGNWPGVTVEKKEGVYKRGKERHAILDLPGIYSLSPYTPEEIVSRNALVNERPDVILDIVDATNLERNLYLTTQLLELDIPMVVALNMMDVLQKSGQSVDTEKLSAELGVAVVPISALKGKGMDRLMDAVLACRGTTRKGRSVLTQSPVAPALAQIAAEEGEHACFFATKAFEGDQLVLADHPRLAVAAQKARAAMDLAAWDNDSEGCIAALKYDYIATHLRVVSASGGAGAGAEKGEKQGAPLTRSDRADRVLTHRIWGIPIFLIIMFLVFHATFSENFLGIGWFIPEGTFDNAIFGTDAINSPGVVLANCMAWCTDQLAELIGGAMPEGTWYTGLICNGILDGVFSVLSFIPQILVMFLFLSILEDSGYMARVAFILDRAFRRFGLSGKACMPLIMCFGCAVPGIMATRTLSSEKERRLAIILAPFFSCGAKLPIWAAFGACLFAGAHGDLIVFGMYLLGIVVAIGSAVLLSATALKGETPAFIMELPAYHAPKLRNTAAYLWEKLKHYLFKAATIITGAIIVIWFLTNFSFTFHYGVDSADSIIGQIAHWFTWLFVPLGFGMGENGWQFVVAAFTGLIAKEMVVGTMGMFAGMGEGAEGLEPEELAGGLFGGMVASMAGGWQAAIAFMAFNLLSVPCMAAVAAARGEYRSAKKLWFAIGYWMLTAYVVSLVLFWCLTYWWIGMIVGLLIVAAIVFAVLWTRRRRQGKGASGAQKAGHTPAKGQSHAVRG